MPVEIYAIILLALRLFSVLGIIDVIRKQRILKRRPIRDLRAAILRNDMYKLTWVALAMNLIPITVDVLTLMDYGSRPPTISWITVSYVFNSSLGTLALTAIIYRMYRKALED